MTEEEEIHRLRKENADLHEAYARLWEESQQKERHIEELEGRLLSALLRIEELERRLGKDSHNSHKPPSSDGWKHQPRPHQKTSRPSGGQPGHQGHALAQVEEQDEVIVHRPAECSTCHRELAEVAGHVSERRQIHELPDLLLRVTEHRVETVCCPRCGHPTRGQFPANVRAPAQYGPRVQALVVYLSQFQLLPMERVCEVWEDLFGCALSEGTLASWVQEAARTLSPSLLILKELLLRSHIDHVDETGGRIKGILHWFHVNATAWLTFYSWHRKRGQAAMNEIGVLPNYTGRAIHDRLSSYDHYGCEHSLCGAHLLRDCVAVAEQGKQSWAQAMYELLRRMCQVAGQWRAQGATALPQAERDAFVLQYFEILRQGFATNRALSPPEQDPARQKPGRKKQEAAKNLLDALLKRAEQVLAFLDDLSIPFTNNLAERDLRMIKIQQKISGTFRSEQGATAFCAIRSYLSTMRKQGRSMLDAMTAVFNRSPFPIAWEPGT
jgi:transposase